jgi:hypothetical protein
MRVIFPALTSMIDVYSQDAKPTGHLELTLLLSILPAGTNVLLKLAFQPRERVPEYVESNAGEVPQRSFAIKHNTSMCLYLHRDGR